ncbi:hypothetical protein IFM89_010089 [Coptis chinensis]|uniref:Uncharacterized protein n=1 Tax=Coptis chinensis TaxID=261450 RepID=A0A835LZ94_9MAGN|nr:hypothetical protein IFM89_010089 [Coptis chinensis]
MATLRTPSLRKPPLAEAVNRIPSRRVLRSNDSLIPTTPVSLMKAPVPNRLANVEESDLRPEDQSISCDLQALAKMVEDEFGNQNLGNLGTASNNISTFSMDPSVVYERGRFYDEYSARRNERLKRKKGVIGQEKKTPYGLGVTMESAKKSNSKRFESVRKSLPSNFSLSRTETPIVAPRYSLRSSCKENKKPPLAGNFDKSLIDGERSKITTRRTRRI